VQKSAAFTAQRYRGLSTVLCAQYKHSITINNKQQRAIEHTYKMDQSPCRAQHFSYEAYAYESSKRSYWQRARYKLGRPVAPKAFKYAHMSILDRSRYRQQRADSKVECMKYPTHLQTKIEQYNLLPEQIYYRDEKGFMIGIVSKRKRIFLCFFESGWAN
jgi:hypothetical protein